MRNDHLSFLTIQKKQAAYAARFLFYAASVAAAVSVGIVAALYMILHKPVREQELPQNTTFLKITDKLYAFFSSIPMLGLLITCLVMTIISAMLSMFGITSERAENGRICVEKMSEAKEGSYTLIFMDVQMPEMNGLDATRTIRKLENTWASSIPIVAMTADAFSENITECLDAGMNGHIAKPIDVKLVIREIRRIREGR